MTNTFDRGTKIGLKVTFSHAPANPADPTAVRLRVLAPDSGEVEHEYGVDEDLVRDGVGVYHYPLVPDRAGLWRYRWEATGDLVAAAEGQFMVKHDSFED